MKIVGLKKTRFTGSDGKPVSGITVYLTEPQKDVEGLATDRIFLTDERVNNLSFTLAVGLEIVIYYNRYGKVASVALEEVNDFDIE